MKETVYKAKSEEFSNLIQLNYDENKTIFEPHGVIGFSLKKEYPDNVKFKKLFKNNGKVDSYCLIRVGYNKDEPHRLFLDCSIQSEFEQSGKWADSVNSEDPNSPVPELIKEYLESRIPFNISVGQHYCFDPKKKEIWNKKTKKTVELRKLVDSVYSAHLKSSKIHIYYFHKFWISLTLFILKISEIIGYSFFIKLLSGGTYNNDEFSIVRYRGLFGEKYKNKDFKIKSAENFDINSDPLLEDQLSKPKRKKIPFSVLKGVVEIDQFSLFASIFTFIVLSISHLVRPNIIMEITEIYSAHALFILFFTSAWILLFHFIFTYIPFYLISYYLGRFILNFSVDIKNSVSSLQSVSGFDFEVHHSNYRNYLH